MIALITNTTRAVDKLKVAVRYDDGREEEYLFEPTAPESEINEYIKIRKSQFEQAELRAAELQISLVGKEIE